MTGRYPIPLALDDFRFGFALTWAVAGVLAEYGYPDIRTCYDGAVSDFDRLQQVLARFLYADASPHGAMPSPRREAPRRSTGPSLEA